MFHPAVSPHLQSTFEGVGGNAYLAEILALIRALGNLIGDVQLCSRQGGSWGGQVREYNPSKVVIFCDNLGVLSRIQNIFGLRTSGMVRMHEYELFRVILAVNTTWKVEFELFRIHSHNKMYLNEIADEQMAIHRRAIKILANVPCVPHRVGRYPECTKSLLKSLLTTDEDSFWLHLCLNGQSVSGHIRSFLSLNRKIIKEVLRKLAENKASQVTFIRVQTRQ